MTSSHSPTPECPRMTKAAREGTAIAEGCALELENAELRKALEAVAKDAESWLKDAGGCDHSVGICMCSEIHNLDAARQALGPRR